MPVQKTLVTDNQMAALRGLAELGMQTTVAIYSRSEGDIQAHDYGDDYLDYDQTNESRRLEVKGWFYHTGGQGQDPDTGAIVTTSEYRLFLPVGTVIAAGDRVVVGGDEYTVQDTDAENTWLPMLTCELEKRE